MYQVTSVKADVFRRSTFALQFCSWVAKRFCCSVCLSVRLCLLYKGGIFQVKVPIPILHGTKTQGSQVTRRNNPKTRSWVHDVTACALCDHCFRMQYFFMFFMFKDGRPVRDIRKHFHQWLRDCHENFDKEVQFVDQMETDVRRDDVDIKRRQHPWSVYQKIELDGKMYQTGDLVSRPTNRACFCGAEMWCFWQLDQ